MTLYVEGDELGFFYYSFYDLNYYNRNLGMFIMTSAVDFFSKSSQKFLYLGTCYSKIESEEYQELFYQGDLEAIVKEGDYEFYL